MGNSIASAMVDKQKALQKEMQAEMLQNQLRGQERMKRMMIAQQMASTRERLWWMGGLFLMKRVYLNKALERLLRWEQLHTQRRQRVYPE